MNPYLELARPVNCIMAAVGVVIGELLAGAEPSIRAALAPVVAAVVCAGGNAINDYFDAEVDAINRPERPIPSGRVSREAARRFAVACFATGVALSALINVWCFAIATANSILLYAYSWRLKGTPLIGNVVISYLVGSCFLFGAAVGTRPAAAVWLFLLAFLANLVREILKDVEDVKGDAEAGLKTLPIVVGEKTALDVALVFSVALAVLTPFPYLDGVVSFRYLYLACPAAAMIVAGAAGTRAGLFGAREGQKLTKIGMMLGLAAFLVALI